MRRNNPRNMCEREGERERKRECETSRVRVPVIQVTVSSWKWANGKKYGRSDVGRQKKEIALCAKSYCST